MAAPVLLLWMAAPWIAFALSRPTPRRAGAAAGRDRAYLLDVARRTWAYFDTFVTAEDRFLPPDNVQMHPHEVIAHRTSPTNIGLGLLATLPAHDLGFIDTRRAVAPHRPDADHGRGARASRRPPAQLVRHPDLAPLAPAYVSTVDSGNLAGALLTLAVGPARRSPRSWRRGRRRCSTP